MPTAETKQGLHAIVFIPAYNEEPCIGGVIKGLPKSIAGVSKITILVVNDGSTDNTENIATQAGADEVVSHPWCQGLARVYCTARERALELKADIFIILDGDGQHEPQDVATIVEPIVQNRADLVIGDRQVRTLEFMPIGNKWGNIIGSGLIRFLLHIPVNDASCGFRALSGTALQEIRIHAHHTYTHEMLIHARALHMRITNMPIRSYVRSNGDSKLIRSLPNHLARSIGTIIRCMLTISPLQTFLRIGGVSIVAGVVALLLSVPAIGSFDRWLVLLALFFVFSGMQLCIVGLIAEAYCNRDEKA